MDAGVGSRDTPTSLTKKRLQLLNWFRNNAESLADAYEGAIRLLSDRDFPGRVHFIAHAVRDIANRLASALDPQLKSCLVQYANEMDHIQELWPSLQTMGECPEGEPPRDTMTIDYRLAVRIDSLVTAHRDSRKRPSNYELLFRYLMRNEPTQAEVNKRLVSDFKRIHGWFMRLTHLRAGEAVQVGEDELQSQFAKFEGMLHSFVGDFFTAKAEIDEILRKANE